MQIYGHTTHCTLYAHYGAVYMEPSNPPSQVAQQKEFPTVYRKSIHSKDCVYMRQVSNSACQKLSRLAGSSLLSYSPALFKSDHAN